MGEREYLSDTNICYKREALEQVKHLWGERYQESEVHWALRDLGVGLLMSALPRVVQERDAVDLKDTLMERVHWARTYAHVRGKETGKLPAIAYACASPALPPVLLFRALSRDLRARGKLSETLKVAPAASALLAFWTLGECIGYGESLVKD
jgi:hypothetical protein